MALWKCSSLPQASPQDTIGCHLINFAPNTMLVEVIREADVNETSGIDRLVLLGSLVGESQLKNTEVSARDHVLQYVASLIC